MKKREIILGLTLSFLGLFAQAQNGLEKIFVERYYVTDAVDAANSHPAVPVGAVTYRIYADMLPGYELQTVFGSNTHPLLMTTSTYFFNQEDYGASIPTISVSNTKKNTVMIDSWLTSGGACNGFNGVLKSEDNGVNNFVNSNVPQLLQNNAAQAGIPLTTQDGMLAGTVPNTSTIGITPTVLAIFGDGSANGNNFLVTNGSWFHLGGVEGPTATNRVLIAQITTDGIFHFELNIQIGTPTSGTENYVHSNPTGVELTIPSLTQTFYPVPVAPLVSITAPANNSTFSIGTPISITADASDEGFIAQVEFFVDGISIGIDASAPYSASFTGIAFASHILTAVATDNEGYITTSLPSNFTVAALVTFNVDMSTAAGFTPATDVVYLTGNFPGASWITPGDAGSLAMTQVGSTLVYTRTLVLPAATYEYKYFKNAGWGGGEYAGGSNRSVVVAANATVNDTWGGSINWANLQWPASGTITLGGGYDVYAQANIQNGVTAAAGVTTGLQAWIGYSTSNTDPSTWTNWVPAPFFGQSYDNDEFKSDLGSAIASPGTYYYASRFQYGSMPYVYGGFTGGYWNGTTNVSGVLTVESPVTKTLALTVFLESLYNPAVPGTMKEAQDFTPPATYLPKWGAGIADKITVEVRELATPHNLVGSPFEVNLSTSGNALVIVPGTLTGNYLIVVKNRNSIDIWSAAVGADFTGSSPIYDFSDDITKAFASNMKSVAGGKFAMFGGNANATADAKVDGTDMAIIDNGSTAQLRGYLDADVTGDGKVDGSDMALVDNNSTATVSVRPVP